LIIEPALYYLISVNRLLQRLGAKFGQVVNRRRVGENRPLFGAAFIHVNHVFIGFAFLQADSVINVGGSGVKNIGARPVDALDDVLLV
jgi:hypothetical protein